MARISLVEQYDNKDVIQQIYLLKTATDGWEERISATEQTANNALTTAEGFDMRIDAVEDANTELNTKVDGFDTRITTAQTTADTAIGNVDTLDRQVTARIADQEVTALDVASAGTGAYAVTAHKQNGNITSNAFNVSKVTSATIGEGSANNSIYLQLNLSDGTTVRTNDTVISITGVEEDIHVTSIVLEDAPDAHTIKAIFTYNNGQSISSNTLTYDYPDIASSSMPGLVMGNDAAGGVQVDGQGRMSVVGWDDFATATELQDAVAAEKSLRETSEAEIRASVEAVEDELGAEGQAGTIRNEIALLKAQDTTLQGNIDAVDTRCDNISSTVSDHGTMLDAQAQSIAGNTADIAANTSAISRNASDILLKQDILSAGTGIEISENVISSTVRPIRVVKGITGVDGTPSGDLIEKKYPFTLTDPSKSTALLVYSNRVSGHVVSPNYLNGNIILRTTDDGELGETVDVVEMVVETADQTAASTSVYVIGPNQYAVNEQTGLKMSSGYIALVYDQSLRVTQGQDLDGDTLYFLGVDVSHIAGSGLVADSAVGTLSVDSSMFPTTIDSAISASSTNPVQNKVISAALDLKASTATTDAITQELAGKQDRLTPGTGISIVDGVISLNLSNANGVSF